MSDTPGPRRIDLLTAALATTPPIERVQLTRIELAPGQAAGSHHHPCDVIGTILSGTVRFQLADQAETILHTGDPFFEPRDAHVIHFDNANDNQSASFLACYLLTPHQTDLIVMTSSPASA